MNRKYPIVIFFLMLMSFSVFANSNLTKRQENIIKSIVNADYENPEQSQIFYKNSNLTPNLIDIVISQIIGLSNAGFGYDTFYPLEEHPSINNQNYDQIVFTSVMISYLTPDWVCKNYNEDCRYFAKKNNFPKITNLTPEEEDILGNKAIEQLAKMGIEYKYSP